ncbi:MAG TPA: universal stress protein [Solirubrobacteraceae bacterium]|nr:universal stress protein [Solirubrobacteraceae bacterium]
MSGAGENGPVVFAYDGSELAKLAIEEAGRLLGPGHEAVVLTVWKTFDVGFSPPDDLELDAADAAEVDQAAQRCAAEGAALAQAAGFQAAAAAVTAAPAWKGIVECADDRQASLIVLGSHGRRSFAETLLGSVASAVANHSRRSVLIVHRPGPAEDSSSQQGSQ